MSETTDGLAKLMFNMIAARQIFSSDRAKGLRLRIEHGVVSFRSATPDHGVDVIAIERRARGILVPVASRQRRLLERLYKAGLTVEQPYFVLKPTTRGWFGIDHYPDEQPPLRQSVLTVSEFEPPPPRIDLMLWRHVNRAMQNERPVPEEQWHAFYTMFTKVLPLVQSGRSQERHAVNKLLIAVKNATPDLLALSQRQPGIAQQVVELVTTAGGDVQSGAADDDDEPIVRYYPPNIDELPPSVTRAYVTQVVAGQSPPAEQPAPRPRRKYQRRTPTQTKPVSERAAEPELENGKRRRWPLLAPVELDPEPEQMEPESAEPVAPQVAPEPEAAPAVETTTDSTDVSDPKDHADADHDITDHETVDVDPVEPLFDIESEAEGVDMDEPVPPTESSAPMPQVPDEPEDKADESEHNESEHDDKDKTDGTGEQPDID